MSPRLAGPPVVRLGPGVARTALPVEVEGLINAPTPGAPLPESVRQTLESSFDTDLGDVRVHTEPSDAVVVDSLHARAFTYGTHIYLGRGEQPTNLPLMTHEVTHVVQQRGAPVFQTFTTGAQDRFEREAEQARVTAPGRVSVRERTGGSTVQTIPIISDVGDWLENRVWGLLNRWAPELVPILRHGVVRWLQERLEQALESIVESFARPVRAIGEVVNGVRTHFANLVAWMRDAAARIARGDCSAIAEAADKIHQVFDALAAPVVERVKQFAARIKQFFQGLWDRFGAPIWQMLREVAGAIWEQVERIGRWIWEKTQAVRDWLARAWRWLKNFIGIGEGEEGQNGILQWFQRKVSAAWDWVMARIAPFKRQLLIIAGVLVMLSPAGPLIAAGAGVAGLLRGIQWLRQHMRSRTAVVQQQSFLRGTILPAILNAVDAVSNAVRSVAGAITSALGRIVGAVNDLANIVGSLPVIGFARGLVDWIAAGFRGLLTWATEGVQGLAIWVQGGLQRLRGFARTLIDALEEILRVVGNFMRLIGSVFRRIWHAIPQCIREAFVDWFIPLILRNIPFFSELASSPEAWSQTRAQVTRLLIQVFVDFDLIGAMRTAFRLAVRVLRIPLELIDQLLEKASRAWDLVLARPLRFIENALKTILHGVGRFMSNILSHLWFGVQGWLLNSIGDRSITLPSGLADWRGWFNLVLGILGLSVDHVIELIDLRFPGVGRRLHQALNFLTGALEWVRIGLTEGPAGLWRQLMQRLSDLANTILGAAVRWVMDRIIVIVGARLTALAASAGLSAILEAVYAVWSAIKTAIEYATRIIRILITVFDSVIQIASGNLDPAATLLEGAMRNAMPVVIGFLANFAHLGGIGERIREILEAVRTRVDNAILALIDAVANLIRGVIDAIRRGIQAVRNWWRERKRFNDDSGDSHEVYFEGEGASARLMFASTAQQLRTYYQNELLPKYGSANSDMQKIRNAINVIDDIQTRKKADITEAEGQTIADKLTIIANCLKKLPVKDPPPPTKVKWTKKNRGPHSDIVGFLMVAKPLSLHPGGLAGSAPHETTRVWDAVRRRQGEYVLGHLLNHNLHGKGENENLTPITINLNNRMRSNIEDPLKKEVFEKRGTFEYQVEVVYPSTHPDRPDEDAYIPEERLLASRVKMNVWQLKQNAAGAWIRNPQSEFLRPQDLTHPLPRDTRPGNYVIALNQATAKQMQVLPGVTETRAAALIRERVSLGGFTRYEQLETVLPKAIIKRLRDDGVLSLG